jgi:hypothetical protein
MSLHGTLRHVDGHRRCLLIGVDRKSKLIFADCFIFPTTGVPRSGYFMSVLPVRTMSSLNGFDSE